MSTSIQFSWWAMLSHAQPLAVTSCTSTKHKANRLSLVSWLSSPITGREWLMSLLLLLFLLEVGDFLRASSGLALPHYLQPGLCLCPVPQPPGEAVWGAEIYSHIHLRSFSFCLWVDVDFGILSMKQWLCGYFLTNPIAAQQPLPKEVACWPQVLNKQLHTWI